MGSEGVSVMCRICALGQSSKPNQPILSLNPNAPLILLLPSPTWMLIQVCGRSAKVQLNSGILARRYGKLAWARDHFEAARALEPGYCEPSYWLGITALNMGGCSMGGGPRGGIIHCLQL